MILTDTPNVTPMQLALKDIWVQDFFMERGANTTLPPIHRDPPPLGHSCAAPAGPAYGWLKRWREGRDVAS